MSSPLAATSSGPGHGQRPVIPLPRLDAGVLTKLQAEIALEIPRDYDTSASQWRLADAQAARAGARDNEIQQEGVQADGPTVAALLDGASSSPPRKKARMMNGDALALVQKVYKESVQADVADGKIENNEDDGKWLQHFDGQFQELPAHFQGRLAEYFTNQANLHATLDVLSLEDGTGLDAHDTNGNRGQGSTSASFDLIGSISSRVELAVEVGKYLRPKDILNLYSVSRDFHDAINGFLTSSMRAWAEVMAPTSAKAFPFEIYKGTCVLDPAGRLENPDVYHSHGSLPGETEEHVVTKGEYTTNVIFTDNMPGRVRYVPSLVWLQMVVAREKRVRDILAALARGGHRVPPETHIVLKKLWLLMDMPSNFQRQVLMKNEKVFTDEDIYVAQLFFVKLYLRLNDPIFGPGAGMLMRPLLGQRTGLTPLWRFLRGKAFTSLREVVQLQVLYNMPLTTDQAETGLPVFGVPVESVGIGHLEGWGRGAKHLLRPDELVIAESTRRQLELPTHLEAMVAYGRVDLSTGSDLGPTLDEMYMSDDDLDEAAPDGERGIHGGCGNVPFRYREWTPKLARKMRWDALAAAERDAILDDDRDEIRGSLAWEDNSEFDHEPYQDDFDVPPAAGAGRIPMAMRPATMADAPATITHPRVVSNGSVTTVSSSTFSAATTNESISSAPSSRAASLNLGGGGITMQRGIGGIVDIESLDFSSLTLNTSVSETTDEQQGQPDNNHSSSGNNHEHQPAGQQQQQQEEEEDVSSAVASSLAAIISDEELKRMDDDLKSLADMDYSELELNIDWDKLMADYRRDFKDLYGQSPTPSMGAVDPEDKEGPAQDEVEKLKKYYRKY